MRRMIGVEYRELSPITETRSWEPGFGERKPASEITFSFRFLSPLELINLSFCNFAAVSALAANLIFWTGAKSVGERRGEETGWQ